MTGRRNARAAATAQHGPTDGPRERGEGGFTLIELLVTSLIIPIVIGALTLALVSVLSLQNKTTANVSDTSDAQVASTYFQHDVESAAYLTTSASPSNASTTGSVTANPMAECVTGTQLLGIEWGFNPGVNSGTGQYQNVVTYAKVTYPSATSLVREYCAGASSTPVTTTVLSSDLPSNQVAPTIRTVSSYSGTPTTKWATAVGVTGVNFLITEPKSTFAYTLLAVPRASASSGQLSNLAAQSSNCGFATIGTGTYASELCFVDFSSYNYGTYDGANLSGETTP